MTRDRCPSACSFLTRLLLVHGTLADYRLQRLIKYSFYKNITFAFMFFFYQAFNGVSGQVSPQTDPLKIPTARPCLLPTPALLPGQQAWRLVSA